MSKISFKYCPICSEELDTGTVAFPVPYSIFDVIESKGKYYSDKTTEELDGHPVRKIFQTYDKLFIVRALGEENRAGYCKNCNKIFAEFEVTDEI